MHVLGEATESAVTLKAATWDFRTSFWSCTRGISLRDGQAAPLHADCTMHLDGTLTCGAHATGREIVIPLAPEYAWTMAGRVARVCWRC